MTPTELIRSYLQTVPGVTSLLANGGDSVYTDALPQSVMLPAVTTQVFGSQHFYSTVGAAGCVNNRMRIDAFGLTRIEADAIYDALREALQGYSGDMLGQLVMSIQLIDYTQAVVAPRDGSDNRRYVTISNYEVIATETVPVLP